LKTKKTIALVDDHDLFRKGLIALLKEFEEIEVLFEAGDDIDDLMILCNADITTKNEFKMVRYRQNFQKVREKLKSVEEKDHVRNFQPPISGEQIMDIFGLAPCKLVGVLKNEIKEAILEGVIKNDYNQAYEHLLKQAEAKGLAVKSRK